MIDPGFVDVAWRDWVLKVLWIALRVGLAIALAEKGSYFFYQGF